MVVAVEPGHPLVFTHIPKTAGTSLTTALQGAINPRRSATGIDGCGLGGFTDIDALPAITRAALILDPSDLAESADLVHGHLSPATTRARYPEGHHMTILREPRVRLISHWLFSRAYSDRMLRLWGGWGDYVRLSRQPLAAYLADSRIAFYTDNIITRLLVYPHSSVSPDSFIEPAADATLLKAARASLAAFEFVGITEDPELASKLETWLGRPLVMKRSNESDGVRRGMETDIAAEVRAAQPLIESRSRLDIALWDDVARTVFPGDGDLAAKRDALLASALERYAKLPRIGMGKELADAAVWAMLSLHHRFSRGRDGA